MPVLNRIADYTADMTAWRRHLHQHPELAFDCHGTAAFIVDRLREFGVDEIHEGIATSGIVAIINGQGAGPTIGLRADMDALPIDEITGADHSSTVAGKMPDAWPCCSSLPKKTAAAARSWSRKGSWTASMWGRFLASTMRPICPSASS
jgi:hypothetical protein